MYPEAVTRHRRKQRRTISRDRPSTISGRATVVLVLNISEIFSSCVTEAFRPSLKCAYSGNVLIIKNKEVARTDFHALVEGSCNRTPCYPSPFAIFLSL